MRIVPLFIGLLSLSLSSIRADDDEPKKGKGTVASTDVSSIAGTYNLSYSYNNTKTSADSNPLPCTTISNFTFTIPSSGSDITTDFGGVKDGKDPIFGTKQSAWSIKEFVKQPDYSVLKVNLFRNDDNETLVCMYVKLTEKNLLINFNPKDPEECPTRFIESTKTCLAKTAYIFGSCKSGACNGEKSDAGAAKGKSDKTEKSDSSSFAMIYLPSVFTLSLPLLALLWI